MQDLSYLKINKKTRDIPPGPSYEHTEHGTAPATGLERILASRMFLLNPHYEKRNRSNFNLNSDSALNVLIPHLHSGPTSDLRPQPPCSLPDPVVLRQGRSAVDAPASRVLIWVLYLGSPTRAPGLACTPRKTEQGTGRLVGVLKAERPSQKVAVNYLLL